MDNTFLYEVRPFRVITGLEGVNFIRSPKSLFLTKDDVIKCLEKGAVYRRFANEGRVERVDIGSVDRFHNEKYMTEEEFEEFKKNGGLVETAKVEVTEPVKEEAPAVVEPEPVKEEVPVVEAEPEKVEEPVVEETPAEEVETVEEVAEEAATEEEAPAEETNNTQPNFQYNGKKKHKK